MALHIEEYVHRTGRTGRCGNAGTAISFITDGDKNVFKNLYDLMSKLSQEIPPWFEKMVFNMKQIVVNSMQNFHKIGSNDKSNFNKEIVPGIKRARDPSEGSNDNKESSLNNKSNKSTNKEKGLFSGKDLENEKNSTPNLD